MTYALTIVTASDDETPLETIAEIASKALIAHGAKPLATDPLGPSALDLTFESNAVILGQDMRTALAPHRCDLAIQPADGRRKQLLLADMDSTIIAGESLDDLADIAGVGEQVASITARAMKGELDFEQALRARLALLKGLPASLVGEVVAGFVPNAGAAKLVATMRAHGAVCLLVSGGLDVFVEPIARNLGFDGHRCNGLEIENGRLTGNPAGPVLDKRAKLRTLYEQAEKLGLSPDEVAAIGDGANDAAMLAAAGLGVAFKAKPAAIEAAAHRIDVSDLTALLYFQGYRASAFSMP